MSWTDERVALLTKYWAEGHSASKIAELMGGLTRNAVIGKAHRLGLPGRPSPLKRKAGTAKKTTRKAAAKTSKAASATATRKPAAKAAATKTTATKPKAAAKTVATKKKPATAMATGTATKPKAAEETAAPAAAPQAEEPAPKVVRVEPKLTVAAAAKAVLKPAKKSGNGKLSLLDLNDRICRWPIGHPDEPDFHFCGEPVNPGFPYCTEHCLEAYQAPQPRRTGPARPFRPNLPRPR